MTKPRLWGFWTKGKLDMLRDYLPAFTSASKSVGTTTYLDLFAGQARNLDRESGEVLEGSPEIALATRPPFTHWRFFEKEHAKELRNHLRKRFPLQPFRVIDGDCNSEIGDILAEPDLERYAPTFAFIDPNGPDCWWETLWILAKFKSGSRYKTELWMLFPVDMFTRLLPIHEDPRPEDIRRITHMFGSPEWMKIYEARRAGDLNGNEARFEYVNLMRWRLEQELGYRWTHSFDVRNIRRPLYSMIFATDNQTGNDIMSHIYSKALSEFPQMVDEVKGRRTGQKRLFPDLVKNLAYEYEAPLPPLGSSERSS